MIKEGKGKIGAILGKLGQFWAILGKFGQVRTSKDKAKN